MANEAQFASLAALDLERSVGVWGGNSIEPAAMSYRALATGQAGVLSRSIKDALATDRADGAGSEGKAAELLRAFAGQLLTCEKETLAAKQVNCAADYRLLALVYGDRAKHMVPRASLSLRNAVQNSILKDEEEMTSAATNSVRWTLSSIESAEKGKRQPIIDKVVERAKQCEKLLTASETHSEPNR